MVAKGGLEPLRSQADNQLILICQLGPVIDNLADLGTSRVYQDQGYWNGSMGLAVLLLTLTALFAILHATTAICVGCTAIAC